MPLIIDTYNVLHVVGVLPPDLAGIDTDGLARLLADSRYRREAATLVCDGTARNGRTDSPRTGRVRVVFSGRGITADDLIAALIRRSTDPRQLTVVSSDRQVVREARRRRCRSIKSEDFLGHLARDHESSLPPLAPVDRTSSDPDPVLPGQVVREAIELASALAAIDEAPADSREDEDAADDSTAVEAAVTNASAERLEPTASALPPELVAEAEAILRGELTSPPSSERGGDGDDRRPPRLPAVLLAVALAGIACRRETEPPPPTTAEEPTVPAASSPWRTIDDTSVIARPIEDDEAFTRALARARETAADAARRFRETAEDRRDRWWVKWAAPTVVGPPEYVWVQPLSWSRFRIEGRLASPPLRGLVCGKELGEIVGFPAEELADWMLLLGDEVDGVREGGFTVPVLEQPIEEGRPPGP